MKRISKQKGFSLIELVITVAIAGILMSIGLPSLSKTMQKSKLTSLHNNLLSALSLARNTAISRGTFATICKSNQSATACNTSGAWQDGWIVFPDNNNNGAVDAGETILAINSNLPEQITIKFSKNFITYGPQGYANGYSGTFTFCDDKDSSNKKGMIISNNGHIRVATSSAELAGCS